MEKFCQISVSKGQKLQLDLKWRQIGQGKRSPGDKLAQEKNDSFRLKWFSKIRKFSYFYFFESKSKDYTLF